jgi:arginase family enzyme
MQDTVRIVGAPTDYGASRRGVDMGPSAIRYADLAAALSQSESIRGTTVTFRSRGSSATTPAATTRST